MAAESTVEKRRDTDALAAIILAVALLAFPVMADIAAVSIAAQKYWFLIIWMSSCYGLVIFPWIRSILRHRREPGVWDGGGKLVAVGIILGLHGLMLLASAVQWLRDFAQ